MQEGDALSEVDQERFQSHSGESLFEGDAARQGLLAAVQTYVRMWNATGSSLLYETSLNVQVPASSVMA